MDAQARAQRARGHRDRAPVVRRHRPLEHGAEQRHVFCPAGDGVVWALDAATGAPKWTSTRSRAARRCGASRTSTAAAASGIRPPSTTRAACSSPSPTRRRSRARKNTPNGSSRPGPNLYTNSLVALDGKSGKLLWYRQAVPHDLRDYDLAISPILTPCRSTAPPPRDHRGQDGQGLRLPRRRRQAALEHLRRQAPERHRAADEGLVPVYPGTLGGVETPMALAGKRVFVPWVDLATRTSATLRRTARTRCARAAAGSRRSTRPLAARSGSTGFPRWRSVPRPSPTTSSSRARTTARSTRSRRPRASTVEDEGARGHQLVPGDRGRTLLVGAAAPGFFEHPRFELIAYSLR